jgi:MoxR-like ATPase
MTTATLLVKSVNKNRVSVIFPSRQTDKFKTFQVVHSYRFEKLLDKKVDAVAKPLTAPGAIFKVTIRVNAVNIFVEGVSIPTFTEHNAASHYCEYYSNDADGDPATVYALSKEDADRLSVIGAHMTTPTVPTAPAGMLGAHMTTPTVPTAPAGMLAAIKAMPPLPLFTDDMKIIFELSQGNYSQLKKATAIATAATPKKPEAPVKDPNYFFVDPSQAAAFTSIGKVVKGGATGRILMVGESGWGKTTLPKHFARINGLEFIRMDCAKVRDPEEWFGFRGATAGSTTFVKSDFIQMVEKGNVVVVLDEINRVEPYISNALFSLLDDSGQISINNEILKVGPNVLFVGTINVGFQYAGTFSIDAALSNRFDIICPVGPIPVDEEAKVLASREGICTDDALMIVKTAEKIRGLGVVDCSLRTTLSIARLVAAAGESTEHIQDIRMAFQNVLVNRVALTPGAEARQIIDIVNSSIAPLKSRKVSLKIF